MDHNQTTLLNKKAVGSEQTTFSSRLHICPTQQTIIVDTAHPDLYTSAISYHLKNTIDRLSFIYIINFKLRHLFTANCTLLWINNKQL